MSSFSLTNSLDILRSLVTNRLSVWVLSDFLKSTKDKEV